MARYLLPDPTVGRAADHSQLWLPRAFLTRANEVLWPYDSEPGTDRADGTRRLHSPDVFVVWPEINADLVLKGRILLVLQAARRCEAADGQLVPRSVDLEEALEERWLVPVEELGEEW